MKKRFVSLTFLLILFPLASQAAGNLAKLTMENQGKKLAVVSISANNFGGSLQGWNSADTTELMSSRLNLMLDLTERAFSADWAVVPASSFITKPEFIALAGEQRDVGAPVFEGIRMPLLSKNRKQLIKARVDKDIAMKLAQVTGAEFLAVIYSEWAVKTGNFVPTSKALTKNVVSIYDASGNQVFNRRLDKVGKKTLGAFSAVYVGEDTIDQWVHAYKAGFEAMYAGRTR
jgi:hypothetical protein